MFEKIQKQEQEIINIDREAFREQKRKKSEQTILSRSELDVYPGTKTDTSKIINVDREAFHRNKEGESKIGERRKLKITDFHPLEIER